MEYRDLGKTGLRVSRIGFGGEHVTDADFATTEAVMRTAMEAGVNIMDVFMPQPDVRSHMGDALGARRKDVLLQGHIGAVLQKGQYLRSRDVKLCDEYIRDFLTRFHTDYIDLGMMHFIDTQEDYDLAFGSEYIDYCQELKRRGVVRFLGASSHNAVTARKMVETGLVDVLLFSINPAFDLLPGETEIDDLLKEELYEGRFAIDPDRAALYRLCEEKGVGITVMKTLAAGRLLDEASSPFGVALTPVQCIHYALERPAVSSVLLGAKTVGEMRRSLAYETATDAERDYSVLGRGARSAMRGKCMYCNHCLPCPAGIDIASVTKYLDLARQHGGAPDTVRAHYAALTAHGGDCIACGKCEERCPFAVPVRENMRGAAEVFGK